MKAKLIILFIIFQLLFSWYTIQQEVDFGLDKSVELFVILMTLPLFLAWLAQNAKGHYFQTVFTFAFFSISIIDIIFYILLNSEKISSGGNSWDLLYFVMIPKTYELGVLISSFIIGGIIYAYNSPYEDSFQTGRFGNFNNK